VWVYNQALLLNCKSSFLSYLLSIIYILYVIIQLHSWLSITLENPRLSKCLQNIPPILGGVPSLSYSPAQPSHTPVSATILG
jgi:hypothetical protein